MPIHIQPLRTESAAHRGQRRPPAKAPGGPRRGLRLFIVAFLALAMVAVSVPAIYLSTLAHVYESQTVKIATAFPAATSRPSSAAQAGSAPAWLAPITSATPSAVNFLLLGTDLRGDAAGAAELGLPSDQRSDALMLLHIPADRQHVYGMSLMRDLWVDIPGHGSAKINAALAYGGVPLLVQTVESMFGQRIDHVAMVNFSGFKGLTDALGGVNVNVAVPFASSHGDRHLFKAGPNKLNGTRALQFVRERNAFSDGDYQRVRNQQAYLRAVLSRVLTPETLANPVRVQKALASVAPYLSVDKGLDAFTVASLAASLRHVGRGDMVFFTLPSAGIGTSADGQSIVLVDSAAVAAIRTALSADALDGYVTANNLTKGN